MPRILVTNDDGYFSPGIEALADALKSLGDVLIVAPHTEASAVGHALTLRRPLRVEKIRQDVFSVDGTPTDCVLLALNAVLDDKRPDLMLSGINSGGNMGEDVTYSGTIAAAMEATLLGLKAIALSQHVAEDGPLRWETAEALAPKVLRRLARVAWPRHSFFNVNFPDVPPEKVIGIVAAAQGGRKIGDHLLQRLDPRGRPYYWIGPQRDEARSPAGSDMRAVGEGKVSVTPIFLDLTNRKALSALKKALA